MKLAPLRTLCIFLALATTPLRANAPNHFDRSDSHHNEYTWDLSDGDQKKQAVGMVTWGVILTIGIALASWFVPNDVDLSSIGSNKPTPPAF